MLTISNITNSAAASSYYEQKDDYYFKGTNFSKWSGKAAKKLKIIGEVKTKEFQAALDGKLPNGKVIKSVGSLRRCGTDLTFSAPKSVSIQALIGGDLKLIKAHQKAVKKALDYVESIAHSRMTKNNITIKENTKNLLIAQFQHDLSREMDPQLHTHCVVINATQRADGGWRALENAEFYRQKMFIGAYYRSELAKEVLSLGYQIRLENSDGRFELAHINTAQIEVFSKRATLIKQYIQVNDLDQSLLSAKQRQVISLKTRQKKIISPRDLLLKEWQTRAKLHSIDLNPQLIRPNSVRFLSKDANEAVEFAVMHLAEREAVFNELDLNRFAIEFGIGKANLKTIKKAIENAVKNGDLIKIGSNYTTQTALDTEKEILNIEKASRNQVSSILNTSSIDQFLTNTNLNSDQKNAINHILSTTHRIIGIQGYAGTGKTTTLKVLKALATTQKLKLVGLAPSSSASKELEATGIKSQTIHSLLAQKYNTLDGNTLCVVDEASMISVNTMHLLLNVAIKKNSRVVLIGDTGQLSAVEAGKPFAQLQKNGMATAKILEIQRQKNSTLKKAVELASENQVLESIKAIKSNIFEINYHKDRHAQMTAEYMALSDSDRAKTLLVCGTNNNRQSINQLVRNALQLEGNGILTNFLMSKDLTKAQSLQTTSYQAGDIVIPNKDYRRLYIKRDQVLQVVNGEIGVVTLMDSKNNKIAWVPTQCPEMSVYKLREQELSIGDSIRFTKNNHKEGYMNGDHAKVVDINKDLIIVEKTDGETLILESNKFHHIDYGYCQTIHSAQGQTCDRVLIEAEATSLTNNQKSYYVAISRAQYEAKIYTDDKEMLPETFSRAFEKSSALELEY